MNINAYVPAEMRSVLMRTPTPTIVPKEGYPDHRIFTGLPVHPLLAAAEYGFNENLSQSALASRRQHGMAPYESLVYAIILHGINRNRYEFESGFIGSVRAFNALAEKLNAAPIPDTVKVAPFAPGFPTSGIDYRKYDDIGSIEQFIEQYWNSSLPRGRRSPLHALVGEAYSAGVRAGSELYRNEDSKLQRAFNARFRQRGEALLGRAQAAHTLDLLHSRRSIKKFADELLAIERVCGNHEEH